MSFSGVVPPGAGQMTMTDDDFKNMYAKGTYAVPDSNRTIDYISYNKDMAQQKGLPWGSIPAGSFKMLPNSNVNRCPAAFLCPQDTTQPIYCPPGFACKDATVAEVCPEHFFCPLGTTVPIKCMWLATCNAGSEKPTQLNVLGLILVMAVIVVYLFHLKNKYYARRAALFQVNLERLESMREEDTEAKMEPVSHPFNIRYDDLSRQLPDGKWIMRGVSGELKAGRTCAIMGPSGAGKSTFISLLTNKAPRTSGTVYINDEKDELSHYSKLIGFVPQEDIMLRELTVRDILMHSAKMRLPSSMSHAEINDKVAGIIQFLGMAHVVDNIIGDEETRGISGGQRKRVNIGMELVADPTVLFLDEPTSGLDSSTALEVCQLLRSIARHKQLTIAAVIHSPSPATFRQFDDLLLLGAGGQTVYMGSRDEAPAYFSSIGFDLPPGESESDFYMEVMSNKRKNAYDPDFAPRALFHNWQRHLRGEPPVTVAVLTKELGHPLSEDNAGPAPSAWHNCQMVIIEPFLDLFRWIFDVIREFVLWLWHFVLILTCRPDKQRKTRNGFLVYALCLRRAALQAFRTPQAFLFDQLLHLGCGLFISIVAQNLQYVGRQPEGVCDFSPIVIRWQCSTPTDLLRELGTFISLGVLFSGISVGAQTFGNEIVVYWRDTAAGMPAIPYFLAKITVDLFRIAVAALMFCLALTFLWPNRTPFIQIYIIVAILYFVAFAMGYFLSTIARKDIVGLIGTGFALAWALALSGVMPGLDQVYAKGSVFQGFSWLWNISAPRYGIESLYIREVQNRPWEDNLNRTALAHNYFTTNRDINLAYMAYIGLGWCFLALLGLKLVRREQQR
ncbi:hypothetical protein RI367_003435 [Sorochytrium milnesiophthora]